jgi:hypothetical protein
LCDARVRQTQDGKTSQMRAASQKTGLGKNNDLPYSSKVGFA